MRIVRYSSLIVLTAFAVAFVAGHRWSTSPTHVYAQTSSDCSRSSPVVVAVSLDEIMAGNDSPVHVCTSPQDSVLWYSDSHKFKVVAVSPKASGGPQHAFYRIFPNSSDTFEQTVSSGPARRTSAGYTYKVSFQLEDGTLIDPEIIVDPPPPGG